MVNSLSIGTVVVIDFPFSESDTKKRRPALVIAVTQTQDYVFCQITSRSRENPFSLPLKSADFRVGLLPKDSYIRTDKLFTGNLSKVKYSVGIINQTKMLQVKASISQLFEILK